MYGGCCVFENIVTHKVQMHMQVKFNFDNMRLTCCIRNVFDPVFMRKVKRTLNAYKESMDHSPRKSMSREAFVDIDEKGAAWYLGHMQSASLALSEKIKDVDFILEIRDARLPFTTENPNLRRLAANKPRLIIFNKAELSNEDNNKAIQQYYESIGFFTLFTSAKRSWRDTVEAVQRFTTHVLPSQNYRTVAHVGLVVGMPNVGKSTLINALRLAHEYQFHQEDFRRSRTPESVSITPGTTRALKLVPLSKDPNVVLYDTPGLTLPGCFAKETGMKLAACGIIPTNDITLPRGVVARYVYDIMIAAGMCEHMAECLHLARPPISFDDCIAMICERSGLSGKSDLGNLDPFAAQRFLLHDFQKGILGKITLDPLPKRFLKAQQGRTLYMLESGSSDDASVPEGDEVFFTHHVESMDVTERYPDHMHRVMQTLKGSYRSSYSSAVPVPQSRSDDTIISRQRGPISTVSAFEDGYRRNTKLAKGR